MIVDVDRYGTFRLPADFLRTYSSRPVLWGFGALSWLVFKRTYSRNGEDWWQTCRRVIEGMFTILHIRCKELHLPWDRRWALQSARLAYDRMWRFKWTPPGRGLWAMGTRFMYERGGAALNNCGFVSTRDIASDFSGPFVWMLQMSMLGVGAGFDTRGSGKATVKRPRISRRTHVIEDSREGWAVTLKKLLDAYNGRGDLPVEWDFSKIRPAGRPLKGFGGFASGPAPLRQMLESLRRLYDSYENKRVDSRLIADTMNIIGRCVVAGGIRRSAQIALGQHDDEQFLRLKQDTGKVKAYRWVSNNSIFAEAGMDYSPVAALTAQNGEPGYLWLENARAHGRMTDPPNRADSAALGSNPCVEQTLWDKELCCLVETYPAHHRDIKDYLKTLEIAYLYAKTVTLVPTQTPDTDAVMQRNRRIGCSMTGIVQAVNKLGDQRLFNWCDRAYRQLQNIDAVYSQWLQVPRSIKTTSVKPSGTVSLLAGATPGVHWDHAPYYLRRIRFGENNPLAAMCRESGYTFEPDRYAENTDVVLFPLKTRHMQRCRSEVPLREKVELAARMQHWWSDNQVSCTADFAPDSEGHRVAEILSDYERRLKCIAFLPARRHGYEQPPYERVTREEYEKMVSSLKPLRGTVPHEEEFEARFCDGGPCETG